MRRRPGWLQQGGRQLSLRRRRRLHPGRGLLGDCREGRGSRGKAMVSLSPTWPLDSHVRQTCL